jgi:hypothetical protein
MTVLVKLAVMADKPPNVTTVIMGVSLMDTVEQAAVCNSLGVRTRPARYLPNKINFDPITHGISRNPTLPAQMLSNGWCGDAHNC